MKAVLASILGALLLGACTAPLPVGRPPMPTATAADELTTAEEEQLLVPECTREQAEQWAAAASGNGKEALQAARCYALFSEAGKTKEQQLADARRGRELAEAAVSSYPRSGLAHYLAAYLTALVAEHDPLHGLERVPVIEQEAQRAAELSPHIDQGGPDRMLGELYLKAPGFPISIGDPGRAVRHYRRALQQAPDYGANRLGLAEALLAEDEPAEACGELIAFWMQTLSDLESPILGAKALELMKRLCDQPGLK